LWFEGDDPEALARAHRAKGYRAAYCPKVSLSDRERLRAIEDAFRREGVAIAEVGRWVNLLDPDADARRKNLATVTEGLALAEAVGARCCVDIAGSFSSTSWFGPHPDNLTERFFDAAVANARVILDAVKPTRTTFCYEMMAWSLPNSPDECLRLLKAVDRKAFSVHLDPCNLVSSPERYYRSSDLIRECYRKLGPQVASVHAKDLTWDVEMAVHFREVRVGLGSIDYGVLLSEHARYAPEAPLMLEHLKEEAEYDAARDQVLAAGARVGVTFD
jgi:sugar phosphate isomerase/epimerase